MPDLSQYDYRKNPREKLGSMFGSMMKFFAGKAYPAVAVLIVAVGVSTVVATNNMSKYGLVPDDEAIKARGQRFNSNVGSIDEITTTLEKSNDPVVEVASAVHTAQNVRTSQSIKTFVIEAEDYDEGGQGKAYWDKKEGNEGGEYRNDDVDIEKSQDADNGYNVGWINSGEWLSYEFNTDSSGSYDISARVARKLWQGDFPIKFRLELDGKDISGDMTVNSTGGWHNWITLRDGTVFIEAGSHKLVFRALENDGKSSLMNVNWFKFTPSDGNDQENSDKTAPNDDKQLASAFIIQAEDYGNGGSGVDYKDGSSGNAGGKYRDDDVDIERSNDGDNGYNVGWIIHDEWLAYDFNVATSATYDVRARVARKKFSGIDKSQFRLELDGQDISGVVNVPVTGNWHDWTTIEAGKVTLSAGSHRLVIRILDNDGKEHLMNINWLRFVPEGADNGIVDDPKPDPQPNPDPDPDPQPDPDPIPTPTPPPSDDGYSYKQGVGPRTISCSGVTLNPGDNIENASSSHSDGTTFCLKKGTYYKQSVTPKNGQRFIGEKGAILDGQRAKQYAFSGGARDIHIENLVIKNYATPKQMGAIKGGDHGKDKGTYGWKIIRNEVSYNGGGGIRTGHEMLIQGNAVHHNDQIGIAGSGDNTIVEGNEIAYNNYQDAYNWGWEAGGTKFVRTDNLIVRNNESHHNHGPGLWADISNIRTLYEGNTIHHNVSAPGIFHEISYDATIRNNHIYDNGWPDDWPTNIYKSRSAIQVSASKNVNVYDNLIERSARGITGVEQCRGTGDHGPYLLTNVRVYNNIIKDSNINRAGTDCGATIDMKYYDNQFIGNSYYKN